MSENNEHWLIEVYKEHTASWKHEDNILYKFGAVMLPVSFVALGVPYIGNIKESNLIILEIISTIGGIILMTFWVSYVLCYPCQSKGAIPNHKPDREELEA